MKILIVTDNYPPFIGGAHRQSQLLARELSQRGHQVNVATVWHGGLPEQEQEDQVTVYRLKQLRTALLPVAPDRMQRFQPPFPDPITILGLRRVLRQFTPDIVHSYGWITYSCVVALMGKRMPLLVSARDYGYSCARRTLVFHGRDICSGPAFFKCLGCASELYGMPKGWTATIGVALGRGLLTPRIRGTHSISKYVQEILRRDLWGRTRSGADGRPPGLIEAIIPSFRENDEGPLPGVQGNIQGYLDQLPAEPFILFVGALRRVKGIAQLLAAYQRLKRPPPLVLIGTIEIDSPSEFPAGVRVLTDFPHEAVMAAWERSLFGVIPSLWPEPLGSVVYEGMSKGKAMIGTTPGGHADMIVHNETGFLVPAGDETALATAMQALIDDDSLSRRLGAAGLEKARQYTADAIRPRFEALYQVLAEKNASAAAGRPA